jgi:GT2 family glycosyltransferase
VAAPSCGRWLAAFSTRCLICGGASCQRELAENTGSLRSALEILGRGGLRRVVQTGAVLEQNNGAGDCWTFSAGRSERAAVVAFECWVFVSAQECIGQRQRADERSRHRRAGPEACACAEGVMELIERSATVRQKEKPAGDSRPRLKRLLQAGAKKLRPRRASKVASNHFCIDHALNISNAGLLLVGWVLRPNAELTAVELDSSETASLEPVWLDRPDVVRAFAGETRYPYQDLGFALFIPAARSDPSRIPTAINFKFRDGSVLGGTIVIPDPVSPREALRMALQVLPGDRTSIRHLLRACLIPLAETSWKAGRSAKNNSAEVIDYGLLQSAPEVSIVIPLYGRIDFLRHQLSAFSNDSDFAADNGVEIIYVLDDPPRSEELRDLARQAVQLYSIPFRIIEMASNGGYSTACNAGARLARGRLLLLLNSDVIPKEPRWISKLVKAFNLLPGCAALGCRLIYEDGSIQHAGMDFRPYPDIPGLWVCTHPLKGMPAALEDHQPARRVPAVTGACLMVDRCLYCELGGLSEDYLVGDFEDADLCHRIAEGGGAIWYEPAVQLYHIERQSMSHRGNATEDYVLTVINMWKHADRWRQRLKAQTSPICEDVFAPLENS